MPRLLAAIALLAVFLAVPASVAHAQTPPATTPTVSTVAVTSNPGTDNTYATGDEIEVTVTFSEAVTVSTTDGTPRLSIDIGDQPRNIPYERAGTNTGELIFGYTVFAGDMDADGISVQANGLALNDGTIQSTDDSTDANLDHSAQTFGTHKVDTEVVLVSNIGQADATDTITISATQSAEVTFTLPQSVNGYDLTGITLDVKTVSGTLAVEVNVASQITETLSQEENPTLLQLAEIAQNYRFVGSASSAGRHVFTLDDSYKRRAGIDLEGTVSTTSDTPFRFKLTISGVGEGTVQIGATASSTQDLGSHNGSDIQDPASESTVPRFSLVGHTNSIPYIYHSEIISKPAEGSAYKTGETIEVLFVLSRIVDLSSNPLQEAVLWFGTGAEHRRTAQFAGAFRYIDFDGLVFAYQVEAGDTDTDGILIGENPLGLNENFETVTYQPVVAAHLSLPSVQLGTEQSVDGSQETTCLETQCITMTVGDNQRPYLTTLPNESDVAILYSGSFVGAIFEEGIISYRQFAHTGSVSAATFGYDGHRHLITQLAYFEGEPTRQPSSEETLRHLSLFVRPAVSQRFIDRHSLRIGNKVFSLPDAELYEDGFGSLFVWREPGLQWSDGDVVNLKLSELPVTATFDAAAYAEDEGGNFDVTVTLGDTFEKKTVTLPLVAAGGGGATSADFSGVPSELVFMPGETEKTFTVELTQDTLDDDDESITLSFGTLPDTVKDEGDHQTATVTIRDDDDPEVDVEFGAAAYSAGEGGSATVEITLSANPERTVIIPLTRADQGGISTADYSGVPASVTFNTGETSKTFTFNATQDDVDDDDESVKLEFGTLPDRVSEGTQDETTISIGDDDDPHVTVEFASDAYPIAEGSTSTVTVTLSADPERTVVIPLVKTEQGGISTADYSGVPASVTFNSGERARTFTVSAPQDDLDDDDESVKLSFGAMPDARVSPGTTDETTLSIDDDDNPHVTVQFTQAEYTVVEGSNVGVRITLSADPERTVSIPIPAANQDGATPADYTVPSSVTFDAGEKEKTVTFAAADDDLDDFGESVKLSFGSTLPDRITKGGIDETKLNIWQFTALDCSAALLCADVTFADRTALDWAWYGIIYQVNSDPASGITDDDFQFGGLEYTIHHIGIVPGIFPEMDNPWSRSHQHEARLWIDIGHGDARTIPSRDHYRDWTLYIDDVTLPLSQAHRGGLNAFLWDGAGIQNLFADWTPSTINRIGIMKTPFADQPQAVVPGVPGLPRAHGLGGDTISVRWWTPHSDGGSAITGYKVQWKEAGESWTDAAAVSEIPEDSRNRLAGRATISGLTRGTLYTVRVIATNAVGDSQPSAEMATRPKGALVRVTESVVNGATLTLRYNRNMDPGSVPATSSFVVLVNGGIRAVDSVSISGNEVRLTLSSAVSAADEVTWLYQEPVSPTAPALRAADGNYAVGGGVLGFEDAANETPRSSLQPLTAQFTNVPASHDGAASFTFNIVFSESVWVGYGFPRNDMLTVTGGTVTSAHWLDRNTKRWAVTIRPDSQGAVTVVLPKERYCESNSNATQTANLVPGAPCAAEDRRLSNEPRATVLGPSSQQQAANSPATGGPGIDGSPRAGETLTATTSGIADEDGMTGAAFAYQWIRHDLSTATDTDIEGATGSTYTVTSADEGKALKVRVTFTDDAGNEESVTSYAVIASPAPTRTREPANSAATGAPGIEGSAVVGQTLTATTTGIVDDDGISTAVFNHQWLAGDEAIKGATASTYTVASGDAGKVIKVRVTFTDDAGNEESVTSQATAAVTQPLMATIHDAPDSHDGRKKFTFELRFSDELKQSFSFKTLRDHAFTVTGGKVVRAKRLEKGGNARWEIHVRPDSNNDVTIVLPATTDCDAAGAICTEDGRMLSNRLELTVSGP